MRMTSKNLPEGIEIHVASRELLVHGELKHVSWRTFDVLSMLASRAGDIVPRDELLHTVWGGTVVDESNLTQAIAHIRRALGVAPDGKSYVETIPRLGYRFRARLASSAVIAELEPPPPINSPKFPRTILVASVITALLAIGAVFAAVQSRRVPHRQPTDFPFTSFEGDETSGNFSPDGQEVVFAWQRRTPTPIYI